MPLNAHQAKQFSEEALDVKTAHIPIIQAIDKKIQEACSKGYLQATYDLHKGISQEVIDNVLTNFSILGFEISQEISLRSMPTDRIGPGKLYEVSILVIDWKRPQPI